MNYEELSEKLQKVNQEQILKAYDRADPIKKEYILKQIEKIDFDEINKLYNLSVNPIVPLEAKIEPISCTNSLDLSNEEKEKLIKIGEDAISSRQARCYYYGRWSRHKTRP